MVHDHLHVLLGDRGEAALPDGLAREALLGEKAEPETVLPDFLWDISREASDLRAQRWCVVIPEGDRGQRLLDLVAPLIARREAQQGAKVRVIPVPATLSAERAAAWKRRTFEPRATLSIETPRYQLLLGDLHEVPLSVQQALGSDGFTGRLAFDRDDDYRAYVTKVLRWEDHPSELDLGDAAVYTVHDGSPATRVGYSALARPLHATALRNQEIGYFNADRLVSAGSMRAPSPDELFALAHTGRPTALFSVCHGDGPPTAGWPSPEARRREQGALCFGRNTTLQAGDVPDAPFLPGGLWLMLACYGAGTPDHSAYWHWLARLRQAGQFGGAPDVVLRGLPGAGEAPFIAALPKRLLALEHGPLAILGHIDLAWTYSFQEYDEGPQSRAGRFLGALRFLVEGERVGVAFQELVRGTQDIDQQILAVQSGLEMGTLSAPAWLGHLWMARNDLCSYVVLGDPAVRLPLRRFTMLQAVSQAEASWASLIPGAEQAPPVLDETRVERAVLRLLLEQAPAEVLAAELGMEPGRLVALADAWREAGRAALRARL